MIFEDDTPEAGFTPQFYPRNPPTNIVRDLSSLNPRNFFAFEGLDGSGKSTLIRSVMEACAEGKRHVVTLKLGQSDITHHALERAKWVNADPVALNLLNWISLFDQITHCTKYYNSESLILSDRYTLSIKMRGSLEGLDTDFMEILEKMLPKPMAFFIIDCDSETCRKRIESRRRITYFEAGSRMVSANGDPMIETSKQMRCSSRDRGKQFVRHMDRMRKEFRRLAQPHDEVYWVDNSGPIEHARYEILTRMGL